MNDFLDRLSSTHPPRDVAPEFKSGWASLAVGLITPLLFFPFVDLPLVWRISGALLLMTLFASFHIYWMLREWRLFRSGTAVTGRIIETEAADANSPASVVYEYEGPNGVSYTKNVSGMMIDSTHLKSGPGRALIFCDARNPARCTLYPGVFFQIRPNSIRKK